MPADEREHVAVLMHNAHGKVIDLRSQLSRAHLELLDSVARARQAGLSLTDIARELGVSKSRAQRLALLSARQQLKVQ